MDIRLIVNLSDVSLCLVALYLSARSFDVYARLGYLRLFILGLSMALVSLSAAADFTAIYIRAVTLNVDWFIYISQIVGFLFILLSLLNSTEIYLSTLRFLNILAIPPLFFLLSMSAILPGIPEAWIRELLGSSRLLLCFAIGFAYFSAFVSKPTRFNLLMSSSFFLLSIGYLFALGQSNTSGPFVLTDFAGITNVIGLVVLVVAVSWE